MKRLFLLILMILSWSVGEGRNINQSIKSQLIDKTIDFNTPLDFDSLILSLEKLERNHLFIDKNERFKKKNYDIPFIRVNSNLIKINKVIFKQERHPMYDINYEQIKISKEVLLLRCRTKEYLFIANYDFEKGLYLEAF